MRNPQRLRHRFVQAFTLTFLLGIGPSLRAQTETATPLPPQAIPPAGTFLSSQNRPPMPFDWLPGAPVYLLGQGRFIIDDSDWNYADSGDWGTNWQHHGGGRTLDDSGVPSPGDGGTNSSGGSGFSYTFSTNGLWLSIFGVSNDVVSLALNNATNYVYEVYSTEVLSSGLTNWNIETEVFPTNTSVMPFTVPVLDRTNNLFFWARDWTGVTENGNTTPDWWFWEYFGTTDFSDTNLDTLGNPFSFDYLYGFDPNVILFTVSSTNQYINTSNNLVQANVAGGIPSYFTVLVDDTNFAEATWFPYTSSNIAVNLGTIQGLHEVNIGLRGLPQNAHETWQTIMLNLDSLPPILVLTEPTNATQIQPVIQICGYADEKLASVVYSISNLSGVQTGLNGFLTQGVPLTIGDTATNSFQCFDVGLEPGTNAVTLTATDLGGNQTITNISLNLDYSTKTNPPVIQVLWPLNGTQVGGSNIMCRGWISDPTALVTVQLALTNGNTNVFPGGLYTNVYVALVERNGQFWLDNLPVFPGTNVFPIQVTDIVSNTIITNVTVIQSAVSDIVSNTIITNVTVIQSAVSITINPVAPDSQLWQPTVNLTGTITDTSYAIWVNGIKGVNNGNGTWSASNVPTTGGGAATFTATAYGPDEEQPDGSYGN